MSAELTAKELLERGVTEMPMLLDGVFPRTGLVSLSGSSDTGKSAFLRQLAMAICKKAEDFLGFQLHADRGSVIYVSTEDDENALAYLLSVQNAGSAIPSGSENFRIVLDVADVVGTIFSIDIERCSHRGLSGTIGVKQNLIRKKPVEFFYNIYCKPFSARNNIL